MNDTDEITKLVHARKPVCPYCSSTEDVIPVVYGLPTVEVIAWEERKKLEIGSRFYRKGDPFWRCKACGKGFTSGGISNCG